METTVEKKGSATAELRKEGEGKVTVILRGLLDARSTGACWRELEKRLHREKVTALEIDASQLTFSGSIGIALVSYLRAGGMTPGAQTRLRGVQAEIEKMIDIFPTEPLKGRRAGHSRLRRMFEEAGAALKAFLVDLKEQVEFIGGLTAALPGALARPKRMRWREVWRVVEKAGANALPVISIFSGLVGFVMALEAAHPLRRLGAEVFIADMIGFASLRDMGPLITAIMLAGRSGSAFAAELGTMKVNEELDALTTMGLEPMQFLVLQRVMAALILTPLLTLYSMVMSLFGGILVMRSLGYPPLMIYHEIIARVELHDFVLGLEKSVIFGLIIGGIGCLRGLQTREGPRAVGVSTTRSVVAGIMLVILANTVFSTVEYFLNK